MDSVYVAKVQQWVECDNTLQTHKEAMKPVFEKKKKLEDDIVQYIESNNHNRLMINISDGMIKFGKRKITQSLSMKLLRKILEKFAETKEQIPIDDIMMYIEESLDVTQKMVMTREVAR